MKTMPCEHRQIAFLAGLTACTLCAPALAAPISSADFDALAAKCAASVPAATLAAVARTESGFDPWVLHDNTTGASIRPSSIGDAQIEVEQLVGRSDSVDIGLMQINSANLPVLGISATDALDPCVSLAAGAAVLRAAYSGGDTNAEQQVALLLALSRYNTGTPFKGIMNGYARAVEENAVPDAGLSSPSSLSTASNISPTPAIDSHAPPAWNLWASAAYARLHGASWLVTSNSDPGHH